MSKPPNRHPREFNNFEDYRAARQARVNWYLSQRPTVLKTVRERVEVPGLERVVKVPVDRVEYRDNPAHLARIAELEAMLARQPDPVLDIAPGELETYRLEGETDDALRARLASRLRDLRNELFLGTITDANRVLLAHLESVGWLGE